MMRELVIISIKKFNQRILNNNVNNQGISYAYMCVLASLYNQAKLSRIPLHYLSLHTIDPEKAALLNQISYFDQNLPIPRIKKKYQYAIIALLFDNIPFIIERYSNNLPKSNDDEFYKAVAKGYEEIFEIFKKYDLMSVSKLSNELAKA